MGLLVLFSLTTLEHEEDGGGGGGGEMEFTEQVIRNGKECNWHTTSNIREEVTHMTMSHKIYI